jgi:O-antigen ligase
MLYLLIGYMFLFIHRPFEVWPVLGDMRLELLYMLAIGSWWVFSANKRWLPNPSHFAYFAFACAVLLCWVLSPWWDEPDCHLAVDNYFKLLVFYLLLVTVVHDEAGLKVLIKGFVAVVAVYMLHSLWEFHNGRHVYQMGIVRLSGVDTSSGHPNEFGATIVSALPFAFVFWNGDEGKSPWPARLGVIGYTGLTTLCVVLTGSRASFLGLLLCAFIVAARARSGRWLLAVAAPVCALALWYLIPGALQSRFETIVDPSRGPANAQESALGRVEGVIIGLHLWQENPLSGCGPGAWIPASGSLIHAHNLFGQVVGEMGTLGLLTFLGILLCFWLNLRKLRLIYRSHPEWRQDFPHRLTQAIQSGLLLLLFLSTFGHTLFRFNWVWYGAFLVILWHILVARSQEEDLPSSPAASSGNQPGTPHGACAQMREPYLVEDYCTGRSP